jgi:transposase
VLDQIVALEIERDAVAELPATDEASRMIQQLRGLRGIGVQSATILIREAFVTHFAHARTLGPYDGLAATPCFAQPANGVALRPDAMPASCDLWEYVPHPVGLLVSNRANEI